MIPKHIGNPFSLVARMLQSRSRPALFTLGLTGLSVLLTPIDLILSVVERRQIAATVRQMDKPIVFICGPARSGTTVTYQILSHYLNVAFFRNFTSLFPRSPITATRFVSVSCAKPQNLVLDNYYGKTTGLCGPSEANHIWSRWVKPDRTGFRTILDDDDANEMSHFFRVFLSLDGRALISKNNNMNVFADVVSKKLPSAFFVCLRRHPAFLVQSLLVARAEIRGDVRKGYGVENTTGTPLEDADPIEEVCRQVQYLSWQSARMQSIIGQERFWIVDYEQLCDDPSSLLRRISTEILHERVNDILLASIPKLTATNTIKDSHRMKRILDSLRKLGVDVPPVPDFDSSDIVAPGQKL